MICPTSSPSWPGDAPGAGRSSTPPSSFRVPDYADCLAAFVRALQLHQPHLVGLSFGGIVALELFRRRTAALQSLVLAGAYAGWAGSLPADVAGERLRISLKRADLPPDQFAEAMLSSMFSESAPCHARPAVARRSTAPVALSPDPDRAGATASPTAHAPGSDADRHPLGRV
jgi:pimeloyl-ACP methyl ester carboxylesterase